MALCRVHIAVFFFFNDTATTEIYTLSLHDALPICFDTSTIGSVIDRLEARGLMVRNTSPADRRVRLLSVTAEGAALLAAAEPSVLRAQQRMLEPLPQEQRGLFMDMIDRKSTRLNSSHLVI